MQAQSSYQALHSKPNLIPGAFSFISGSASNNGHTKTTPKKSWQKKPDILQRDVIQNVKMGKNNSVNSIKSQGSRQNTLSQCQFTEQQQQSTMNDYQQSSIEDEFEVGQCYRSQHLLRQSHKIIPPYHQKSLDEHFYNSYNQNKMVSGSEEERMHVFKQISQNSQKNSQKKISQAAGQSIQCLQQSGKQGRNNCYSKIDGQQISQNSENSQMQSKNTKNSFQTADKKQQRSNSVCKNNKSQQQQQQQQNQRQNRLVRSTSQNINQFSNDKEDYNISYNNHYNEKEKSMDKNKQVLFQQNSTNDDLSLYNNKLQFDIIENILNKEEQYQNWRDENIQLKDLIKNLINELNDYKKECVNLENQNEQLQQSISVSKHNYQMELIKFSDQIQKFKNIQQLYQNEKQVCKKFEKDLILKDQELADTKMHLKNSILFLLEQRDSICQNNYDLDQNNSFSFEEKMEAESKLYIQNKQLISNKIFQQKQQDNFKNLMLRQFDKYINSLSQIINELKITYSSKLIISNKNLPKQVNNHLNQIPQKSNTTSADKSIRENNISTQTRQPKKIFNQKAQINKIDSNKLANQKDQTNKTLIKDNQNSQETQLQNSKISPNLNKNKENVSQNQNNQQIAQNKIFSTQFTEQDQEDQGTYIPSLNRFNKNQLNLDNQSQFNKNPVQQRSQSYSNLQNNQEGGSQARPLASIIKSQDEKIQIRNELKNSEQYENKQEEDQQKMTERKLSEKTFEFNETFQQKNDGNLLNNETLTFDFEASSSKKQNDENSNQPQQQQQQQKIEQLPINKEISRNRGRNSSLGSFEYSKFKQNLEDHINDSIFQNTAFNSQLLEQSAAVPIQNKNILNQQQSITDFEIAEDSEKAGIFNQVKKDDQTKKPLEDNLINKIPQVKSFNSSFSDSENENRCQSLTTKILQTKNINYSKQPSNIKNNESKQLNDDKNLQKLNAQNTNNNSKKPPIDLKDKENRCPNNNNNNNSNNNIEQSVNQLDKLKPCQNSEQKSQIPANNDKGQHLIVVSKEEFIAQQDGHLSFKQGEKIQVLKQTKNGWWIGMCKNKIGYFPFNFVEEVKDQQSV